MGGQRETGIARTLQSARQEKEELNQKDSSKSLQNESSYGKEEIQFPITPAKAIKYFSSSLTSYEQSEILDYPQIYYLG